MKGGDVLVGCHGDDYRAFKFTAICTEPMVPEASKGKGGVCLCFDGVPLALAFWTGPFVKGICWNEATFVGEAGAEGWFFEQGFCSGVDDEGKVIRVFHPMGNEPPADKDRFNASFCLFFDNDDGFCWGDFFAGGKLGWGCIAT